MVDILSAIFFFSGIVSLILEYVFKIGRPNAETNLTNDSMDFPRTATKINDAYNTETTSAVSSNCTNHSCGPNGKTDPTVPQGRSKQHRSMHQFKEDGIKIESVVDGKVYSDTAKQPAVGQGTEISVKDGSVNILNVLGNDKTSGNNQSESNKNDQTMSNGVAKIHVKDGALNIVHMANGDNTATREKTEVDLNITGESENIVLQGNSTDDWNQPDELPSSKTKTNEYVVDSCDNNGKDENSKNSNKPEKPNEDPENKYIKNSNMNRIMIGNQNTSQEVNSQDQQGSEKQKKQDLNVENSNINEIIFGGSNPASATDSQQLETKCDIQNSSVNVTKKAETHKAQTKRSLPFRNIVIKTEGDSEKYVSMDNFKQHI